MGFHAWLVVMAEDEEGTGNVQGHMALLPARGQEVAGAAEHWEVSPPPRLGHKSCRGGGGGEGRREGHPKVPSWDGSKQQ